MTRLTLFTWSGPLGCASPHRDRHPQRCAMPDLATEHTSALPLICVSWTSPEILAHSVPRVNNKVLTTAVNLILGSRAESIWQMQLCTWDLTTLNWMF